MKKLLLIAAASLMAVGADAAGPYLKSPAYVENFPAQYASPDGKYIAVSQDGAVYIINVETNKESQYYSETSQYSLGQIGYAFSSNGLAVGSEAVGAGAVLDIEAGEWTALPGDYGAQLNAFAIAEDGSFVVGNMTNPKDEAEGEDDRITYVPVIWERKPDGKFSSPKTLPYPARDWTGRLPQSTRAIAVSGDNNRIAGQVTDCMGYQRQPIYWERQADDSWKMIEIMPQMLNPKNVTFPAFPLQTNPYKLLEEYMTPSRRAEYEAALEKWKEDGSVAADYPEVADYVTKEQIDEFQANADKYNAVLEEQYKWYDVYFAVLADAPSFVQNAVCFNGKTYACDANVTDPNGTPDENGEDPTMGVILRFNVNDNTVSQVPGITINSLTNDDVVLASQVDDQILMMNSVVVLPEADEPSSWRDWMTSLNPEFGTWIGQNMCHDYTTMVDKEVAPGQWEQVEETMKDVLFSGGDPGGAFTTGSANLIVVRVDQIWNTDPDSPVYMGYVFPTDLQSGIEDVTASKKSTLKVEALRGGVVRLNGDADALHIADLQGRVVFETESPAAETATGLNNGIYIVKATAADGSETIVKAIF